MKIPKLFLDAKITVQGSPDDPHVSEKSKKGLRRTMALNEEKGQRKEVPSTGTIYCIGGGYEAWVARENEASRKSKNPSKNP